MQASSFLHHFSHYLNSYFNWAFYNLHNFSCILFLFDNITRKLGQYRDHLLNHIQEKNEGTDANPGSQRSPCYLSCIWVLNFCHTPWTLLVSQIFILIYYGTVSGLDQITCLIPTNWHICLELTSPKHIFLLRVPVILKRFSKNFHQGQW